MSQQNVDLAGQVLDALNRRDLSRLIALTSPEIEWHSIFAELGEGGMYQGPGPGSTYATSTRRGRSFVSM